MAAVAAGAPHPSAATRWLTLVVWMGTVWCSGGGGSHQEAAATVRLSSDNVKVRECESIAVSTCRPVLRYNSTATPNLVGHESQPEAEHALNTFQPLLQYGCSSRLRFFLCAAYVPLCTDKVQTVVGPCRPLCEDVRQRCEPVLNRFGFRWLSSLNCSRFPPQNDQNHMCMEGPAAENTDTALITNRLSTRGKLTSSAPIYRPHAAATSGSDCSRMRNAPAYVYVNRTQRCMPLCRESAAFTAGEKRFAEAWMTIWSVPCFISTLFAVVSFLIDSSRLLFQLSTFFHVWDRHMM